MADDTLEALLSEEVKGSLLRITRQVDFVTGAYHLTASAGETLLHSQLHPDDPLPFSDGEWGTLLLEDILGDIPDPHSLVQEAARVGQFRLLILQPLGEGRDFSRLRQIAARHSPVFAGKELTLANGGEAALLVIPLEETAGAEFLRRRDRLPLRFTVKIGAPSRTPPAVWGDIHFAEGFQRALLAAGHDCTIQYLPEWEEGDENFDVVVHLKGLSRYRLKPRHINLLWMINHPGLHREEELAGYDGLMVASRNYAEELSRRLERPVVYAPQAVDVGRFTGEDASRKEKYDFDIIFIGNNHQHTGSRIRPTIAHLLHIWEAKGRPWKVGLWGKFWEGRVPAKWIQAEQVSPEEAARIYRRAKIVLNDHQPDMKANGFINERTFVIGACGAFQISDHVKGIEDLPVVFYDTPQDLGEKIEFYLAHPEEREKKAQELQASVQQEYTFADSVALLEGLLGKVRRRNRDSKPAPLVSIIATTYNRKELLPRALKSAVDQTFSDWEMILVNDGGEDVSDVVKQIGDSRIRYINADHGGKGHALNVGLRLARGRYIAYLDDDDYYYADHLARLVRALRESPAAGMVYTDHEEIREEHSPEGTREIRRQVRSQARISPALCFGIHHMAVLHYGSLLEEVGLYDEQLPIFIDLDMHQRLVLASHPRHLPGASVVHILRQAKDRLLPDHIHAIRHTDLQAYLRRWLDLISRATARMEAHPQLSVLWHDFVSFRQRLEEMVCYLAFAAGPRQPAALAHFAREFLQHTYLAGVREGLAAARGERPIGLEAAPEAAETLAWLEGLEALRREIDRLHRLCDEQWQALQRIRSTLPYKLYRRAKSFAARLLRRKPPGGGRG